MTYATKAGFVVGNSYALEKSEGGLRVGTVLTFVRDDGSNCPQFKLQSGDNFYPFLYNLYQPENSEASVRAKQEAYTAVADLISQAKATLAEAKALAEANSIDFSIESMVEELLPGNNIDWNSSNCY